MWAPRWALLSSELDYVIIYAHDLPDKIAGGVRVRAATRGSCGDRGHRRSHLLAAAPPERVVSRRMRFLRGPNTRVWQR